MRPGADENVLAMSIKGRAIGAVAGGGDCVVNGEPAGVAASWPLDYGESWAAMRL